MLYNAVANGGKMMRPYLVKSIKSNGVVVKNFEPEVIEESICKPEVITAARRCLEAVITEGTAINVFKDFPFSVAGKTGTAHVASGDVKYYDGVYQASFAGYFPADKPEYSCIVLVKTKPHAANHFGGQLAAPVFKEIATKLYAMYVQKKQNTKQQLVKDSLQRAYAGYNADVKNVLKTLQVEYKDQAGSNSWSVVNTDYTQPVIKAAGVQGRQMPDVRNMTMKDALYVLENKGVKVAMKGRGKVIMQDILPGTPITKNQTITLLLN
jgi:cell division protein FtsI (penicillin-binding protein 3)